MTNFIVVYPDLTAHVLHSMVNYHFNQKDADMRRNSKTYRLQMIKETAERHERAHSPDPMVRHIEHLISDRPNTDDEHSNSNRFSGHHYDQSIEGWVSDRWS